MFRPFSRPSALVAVAGFLCFWVAIPGALGAQDNVFPSTGNAGIGTTNPQAPLEIQATGPTNLIWDNGNALLQGHSDAIVWNRAGFKILLDADDNQSVAKFQLFRDTADTSAATPVVSLNLEDGTNSFIGTEGNFGIGTTSPAASLHVVDPVYDTSDHVDLHFNSTGNVRGVAIDADISGNWAREFKLMTGGSGSLFSFGVLVNNDTEMARGYIGGNSTENAVWDDPWMVFLPDGKVGVGLTAPSNQLSVAGVIESTTGGFVFPDGTVQTTASAGGSAVYGESSSAPANSVYVSSTGHVGIGTAYPGSRLAVSGAVESLSTGFVFPDGTIQTTAANAGSANSLAAADGVPSQAVYVDGAGNVGVGTTSPTTALDVRGTVTTHTLEVTGGADIAEPFEISDAENIRPGMVVSIDPKRPGGLRMSAGAYDRTVAGVVSGAGGVNPGLLMGQADALSVGDHPVALTGRVWVMADATDGPIRAGDLLTTAATPGHAMRVADHGQAVGAILGKAMTELEEGRGLVLTLVALQ